jgi:predicted porin
MNHLRNLGGFKMRKCVLAILFIFALSSVAFASPLTDYSKGKAALDLNYRVSPDYDASLGVKGTDLDTGKVGFDGDSNVEWGFTYGIGNNWALQYRQATPTGNLAIPFGGIYEPQSTTALSKSLASEGPEIPTLNFESKTRVEEYNVLYKLDKNFSLFTGIVRANPSVKVGYSPIVDHFAIQGDDKNIWQFGVVAVKPLNKDFTTYGIASFGSDYRNWEVGLGYKVAKDIDFNVNYRDMKVDDMKLVGIVGPDLTTDSEVKGWGFGVTYNF